MAAVSGLSPAVRWKPGPPSYRVRSGGRETLVRRACASLGTPAVLDRRQLKLAKPKNRLVCWAVLSFLCFLAPTLNTASFPVITIAPIERP
jgi:hypothetical protein